MAVVDEITPYPFDPTGTMLANRVPNEQQIISPPNFRDFYFIIPKAAPFFGEGLTITIKDLENKTKALKEGVDYYLTHRFISASRATAKPIYGSITFLDKELAGVVTITYQTLGGIWTLSEDKILEILSNTVRNPRITSWDSIAEMPVNFPVIDHEWDLVDMVGASGVVAAIDKITEALNASGGNAITQHIADKNNPHGTNKTQVGLGNVQNFAVASDAEAQAGTSNAAYMTPLRTRAAITKIAGDMLANHTNDKNNPHGTTAAQVGLGNVPNYSVATNAEALAGALNTRFMTPLLTKAVVDAFRTGDFAAHVNNKLNPHEVDKLQVGLALVENYAMASPDDARLGTRNDVYMTPLRVRQAIQSLAGGDLNVHVTDMNNPHNTTKAQVGLSLVQNYGVADSATTLAGTRTDLYTTPKGVIDAIKSLVADEFAEHEVNISNPHQTTAEQVGAYTKAAVNQLLTGYLPINGKAANTALFDGMDSEQYKQYVLAGKAANTGMFNGRTDTEYRTWVLSGTANDSNRLGGLTLQEVLSQASGSGDLEQRVANQRVHSGINASTQNTTWSLVATMPIPAAGDLPNNTDQTVADAQYLVAGGDNSTDVATGLYHVRLALRGANNTWAPKLSALNITGVSTGVKFGVVTNTVEQTYEIYVCTTKGRNPIVVTDLSKGQGETKAEWPEDILTVAPAGIVYAVMEGLATTSQFKALEDSMTEVVKAITAAFTQMVPA